MVLWLSGQATVHAAVAMGLAEHGPNSKDGTESAPRPLDEHFRGEPNLLLSDALNDAKVLLQDGMAMLPSSNVPPVCDQSNSLDGAWRAA